MEGNKEFTRFAGLLSNGAILEAIARPGEGLDVTVDDIPLEDIREIHVVSTTHSGAQIKIRLHRKLASGISEWHEIYIDQPVVYLRAYTPTNKSKAEVINGQEEGQEERWKEEVIRNASQ